MLLLAELIETAAAIELLVAGIVFELDAPARKIAIWVICSAATALLGKAVRFAR